MEFPKERRKRKEARYQCFFSNPSEEKSISPNGIYDVTWYVVFNPVSQIDMKRRRKNAKYDMKNDP